MLEICFTRRRVCRANRVQSFSIYLKYYPKHLEPPSLTPFPALPQPQVSWTDVGTAEMGSPHPQAAGGASAESWGHHRPDNV